MTAEEYFCKGVENYEVGKLQEALADFTQAIELDPNYFKAYYNRGIVYDNLKQYEKAVEDYTQAIALAPKYAVAYYGRGIVYDNLKQFEKAVEDYTQAIILDPNYAVAYCGRGIVYCDLKQYEKAIDDYTQAIVLVPNYVVAHYNRGVVYNNLKLYEKAVDDFTQAITLEPNSAVAYYNRGIVYNNLKQYEKAIDDFTQAITLEPNFTVVYFNRGNSYNNLKQYEKAIDDFTQAIILDSNYVGAYNNRGNSYNNLKQYEKAIDDYTQAITLDPNFALAYNNQGNSYNNLKQFKKAINDFTQAITLDPNFALAYNNRGNSYNNLKQYEKAIDDFTQAIILDSNFAKANLDRGIVYNKLENYPLVQLDWIRLIQIDNGKIIAQNFSRLATFFRDIAPVPFVVRQMFEKVPESIELLSFQNLVVQTYEQCKVIDSYLAFIGLVREVETLQPAAYHALRAYTNYLMGTVGVAFEIFDEVLDNQLNHTLSLREHYYYLRSVEAFQEPTENLQEDALEKAALCLANFEVRTANIDQQTELYYAGLLFFYADNVEQAHHCFTRIFLQYPPAAYMQVLTLEKMERREDLNKKIDRIRQWEFSQSQPQFLHGFSPRTLSLNEPEFLEPIYDYLLHSELIDAIQIVRQEGDVPFQSPAFWEAFTISEDDLRTIRNQCFEVERKRLDEEYQSKFSNATVNDDVIYQQNYFKSLQEVTNANELEGKIAEYIKDWRIDPKHYEYYIKYFHYQQKLGIMATYSLQFYLNFIKNVKAKTSDEITVGSEKLLEEVAKQALTAAITAAIMPSLGLFSIPVAVTARILGKNLSKKALDLLNSKPESSSLDYQKIKRDTIADLLMEAEEQPDDNNNAIYEKYIIPELQKWLTKK